MRNGVWNCMADRRGSGFGAVTVATIIAGAGGYAITTLAGRGLTPEEYSHFAVFWGGLFLAVGALSGIQQEFTRATTPTDDLVTSKRSLTTLERFAPVLALLGAAAVVIVVVPIVGALFPEGALSNGIALAIGAGLSALIALLTGVQYGLRAWRVIVVVIVGDVALRLVFIGIALYADGGPVAAGWAAVAPYPFVLAFLLIAARRTRFVFDVHGRRLAHNLLSTVGAAVGTAVLVSGAPLLIGLAAGSEVAGVGPLVFALTLTRAPLVVGVLALQSFLVVWFRGHGSLAGALARVLAVVTGLGLVFAALVYVAGVPVIVFLAGDAYAVDPWLVTALVLASLCTALLGVTGAAALAASRHGLYVGGWTAAAAVAVAALVLLPLPLSDRVVLGLAVGPVVGIGIHLFALRLRGPLQGEPAQHAGGES